MGLKLNATTGGGSVELDVPNSVGSDFSVTVPAITGNLVVRDSFGNLGVGTDSPNHILDVQEDGGGAAERMRLFNTGSAANDDVILMLENGGTDNEGMIWFGDSADNNVGQIRYDHANDVLELHVNAAERARFTSDGNLLIGRTSDSSNAGCSLFANGFTRFNVDDGLVSVFNRSNDGALIHYRSNNTTEGTITISGSTTSYNGAHLSRWSQLPGNAERVEILRGSVLSNIDEMCEWGEEDNEQLNRMQVSNVEGDVNVSGVFQSWDDDDDIYVNDFYCAMTGDFVIRIAQGTTVARGDLLMSAGDGTAKPQDDDIVRSKTVAKVTSTTVSETYADGSYCVPCVLMAC